ncbi:hypothetical protein SAMN05421837_101466 [Amycolatopsis pretoriensis]|uniref:Zinc-finger n=1 Tax=Amycolatopsis pretoriensis TaxID=218821 RepID=A0A1H5Q5G6_9PSEU|nr:hypothetical protein [Amycolatopsis pretoriensis]SEF20658.1 hypothetical protein SAMN05421837_101466 [Amycolatopsis pretoriensis]
MSDWDALNEFLRTDPRDIGCDRALDALHTYSEMAAAGKNPAELFPGLAAHLESCSACSGDHEALVRAIREFGGGELC